jgi:hypothetical protein
MMKKIIFSALLMSLFMLSCLGVEPDAITKADAMRLGLAQDKLVLLIVCDTNNCTGCRTLQYGILPKTKNPPMAQFLKESFIHWESGPDQKSTEFREYTGKGTIPLPIFYLINPKNPNVFVYEGYGDSDPNIFYNWLRIGLLKNTAPVITYPQDGITVTDKYVDVQAHSISTNVLIRGVYYRFNGSPWTYKSTTNKFNWNLVLNQANILSTNKLEMYGIDSSLNKTLTNSATFYYMPKVNIRLNTAAKTITVSWPKEDTGFRLVQSSDGFIWSVVPGSERVNSMTLPVNPLNLYFQLIR